MHIPVLIKEVLKYLDPKPNENFIDCTIGEGGHAKEILQKTGPKGMLLGIDWDKSQAQRAQDNLKEFGDRAVVVAHSYAKIQEIVWQKNFNQVDGLLLDLGFSSRQLESGRGFSFQNNEPLDMRYSDDTDMTAQMIVNTWPQEELERILREFGEERFSKKIAQAIVETRGQNPIATTFDLKNVVEYSIPRKFQHGKIHPATRTFQALRIAVNRELDNVQEFLPQALNVLSVGGRLGIISFHSLEDRIVKNFFKQQEQLKKIKIVTKKPVIASDEERKENPRSRSAKLRVIVRV